MSEAIFHSEAVGAEVHAAYRAILDAWPVLKTELRVPTRHGETFVVTCGPEDAPPLVAFHGAQGTAATWMFDTLLWTRAFRVHCVDVPGDAGFSAPVRPPLGGDAYVEWLDDLLAGLGIPGPVALVGVSLGGWLALDYATKRPERVARAAVLCPAGVGAQKNLLALAAKLGLKGDEGRRQLAEMVTGPPSGVALPPAIQRFVDFVRLVMASCRPRSVAIPIFTDAELARLTMPLLAIVGGRDVLIDSEGTRDRLAAHAPGAEVRYLPDAFHVISGQTQAIFEFLTAATS
jgi:pimeloyl-ACP methyl ester carboxylesterase